MLTVTWSPRIEQISLNPVHRFYGNMGGIVADLIYLSTRVGVCLKQGFETLLFSLLNGNDWVLRAHA